MRRRPHFPPPPPLDLSEWESFRLPIKPNLVAGETEEERKKRERQVRRETIAFLRAVRSHLGEDEAKLLVSSLFSNPRHRPRRSATNNHPEQIVNRELLLAYDEEAARGEIDLRAIPRLVSKALSEVSSLSAKRRYGANATTIEKRLRRLLKEREGERKNAEKLRELDQSRFGELPPTLLEQARDTKSST
jgi:hypothetical protein